MKLRIGLVLLLGMFLHGAVLAAATAFQEGMQYTLIQPQPPVREGDEVEVIEFFWYGCPHCNSLEPHMKSWLANKPDHVRFERIPAPFQGKAELHAKTFYALQLMGELDRLHDELFHALSERKLKLDTQPAMEAFLAEQGVDVEKFASNLDSFAVNSQLNRARVLAQRYGLRGVPSLIVDGRYKSGKGFSSYADFTELVDFLAAKVVKERQGAASSGQ
jgi:thiol:disulfide interchange protein DsbA